MIQKVSLFKTKRDFLLLFMACGFIFTYSILIEYNNYKNLTKFDSSLVYATVLKQYEKTKLSTARKSKKYQVLKLKAKQGFSFYTTTDIKFPHAIGKTLKLEIWAGDISFYEYMSIFYAFSKIISTDETLTLKQELNTLISSQHKDENVTAIYKALYTASPLDAKLQNRFSYLGISHLLAISGFHLGVLSALLFFLFKFPYKFLQNRYFPYRSYKRDSFLVISTLLLCYLLFLDSPASLLRAFAMLVIGFLLYDRGFKIISMQTLFLTALIILSFFPRLYFALGFWLSVAGVFYIFLFLIHFKNLSKSWQFVLVPFWVYLMMLAPSLFIFENFSYHHPLSIIWTSIFTLFYPLSIFLHLLNLGYLLDSSLIWLINLNINEQSVQLSWHVGILFLVVSILSIYKKSLAYLLLFFSISIFIYSIYHIA